MEAIRVIMWSRFEDRVRVRVGGDMGEIVLGMGLRGSVGVVLARGDMHGGMAVTCQWPGVKSAF